jgi:hypothetical protein
VDLSGEEPTEKWHAFLVPNGRGIPQKAELMHPSTSRWVLALLLLLLIAPSGCRAATHSPRTLDSHHWFRPTSRPVISSPVVWDVNGDGVKEIAVGSWDGHFYLLNDVLEDVSGWPQYSPKGFFSSPALGDLDGDGDEELLVGSDSGKLFAWDSDGKAAAGFPRDLGYQTWSSPVVINEVFVAIGGLERMYVLDSQGRDAPGWPQPMRGWADATAASDGSILTITTLTPGDKSQGWLYAWALSGDLLPGFPVELALDTDSSPALADLDGDGRRWIVFGDDGGWLHVVDTNGRERSGFPVRTAGPAPGPTPTPHPPGGNIYSIEASPAVADLEGDGHLEIAVGSWDGRMYLWDDAGNLVPGWPVAVADQIISSAALVDLDADARLDIVVGSKDGHLYGWTANGESLAGFPFDLGDPVFSSPWVGDLEQDGRADIVVGADNGIHLLRDVGPLGRQAWPMFHADELRTGATR